MKDKTAYLILSCVLCLAAIVVAYNTGIGEDGFEISIILMLSSGCVALIYRLEKLTNQ